MVCRRCVTGYRRTGLHRTLSSNFKKKSNSVKSHLFTVTLLRCVVTVDHLLNPIETRGRQVAGNRGGMAETARQIPAGKDQRKNGRRWPPATVHPAAAVYLRAKGDRREKSDCVPSSSNVGPGFGTSNRQMSPWRGEGRQVMKIGYDVYQKRSDGGGGGMFM